MRLFFEFGEDGGDELGDVADDAVVGDFEDGGFGVAVDGDDGFALVHAGEMLDCSGDADGDVEFGLDGFSGLADLFGVGAPAGVDDGASSSDGGTELVGESFDVLGEAFGAAYAAATGDDDVGFGEETRELRSAVLPVTLRRGVGRLRSTSNCSAASARGAAG